jgi:peptide/nickel transport system permease protein
LSEQEPEREKPSRAIEIPRAFLGRLFLPLIKERKSLAGVLAWMGLGIFLFYIFLAIAAPILAPFQQTQPFSNPVLQPPSLRYLMGTDNVGRDVLSRVIWGARTSLEIMAIGVFIALAVGFPAGLLSGYIGGITDRILVLVMDSIYAFPGLLLAALIAAVIGKGVFNIGIAITVIYIPLYFRVTRNQTLSVREEPFVEAARALGAKAPTIMLSYVAHSVIIAIPVIFSLSAADAILTAAGLSYLGLGLEVDTPGDWGRDLSDAQQWIGVGVWWTSVFPGLMIILLTVGLSFLGEGLNDIVNPILRKERG